jgi:catechol 2,3-dioxygenase-like lactoylglutathione lyase family enzyme
VLTTTGGFSTFAVSDLEEARRFYGETLGLDARTESEMGLLELHVGDGLPITVYPRPDHQPAAFTVLNFLVPDIEAAVGQLEAAGIGMQRYDVAGGMQADARGIYRGYGPAIAWFTDPSGNILSVIEQPEGRR